MKCPDFDVFAGVCRVWVALVLLVFGVVGDVRGQMMSSTVGTTAVGGEPCATPNGFVQVRIVLTNLTAAPLTDLVVSVETHVVGYDRGGKMRKAGTAKFLQMEQAPANAGASKRKGDFFELPLESLLPGQIAIVRLEYQVRDVRMATRGERFFFSSQVKTTVGGRTFVAQAVEAPARKVSLLPLKPANESMTLRDAFIDFNFDGKCGLKEEIEYTLVITNVAAVPKGRLLTVAVDVVKGVGAGASKVNESKFTTLDPESFQLADGTRLPASGAAVVGVRLPARPANGTLTILFKGKPGSFVRGENVFVRVRATTMNASSVDPDPVNGVADATLTPAIRYGAILSATKRARLTIDNNNDGVVNPDEVITYTIDVFNRGDETATNAVLVDVLDDNTHISGKVAARGHFFYEPISRDFGLGGPIRFTNTVYRRGKPDQVSLTIRYDVRVRPIFESGVTLLTNQAVLNWDGMMALTDDPTVPGVLDPTITVVVVTNETDVTNVWINPNGGNFNSATNWLLGRVPGSNDLIHFPDLGGMYSVSVNGDVSVRSVLIDGNAKLLASGRTITARGVFSLRDGELSMLGGVLQVGRLINQALIRVRGTVRVLTGMCVPGQGGGGATVILDSGFNQEGTVMIEGSSQSGNANLIVPCGMENRGELILETTSGFLSSSVTSEDGTIWNQVPGEIRSLPGAGGNCFIEAALQNESVISLETDTRLNSGAQHVFSGFVEVFPGVRFDVGARNADISLVDAGLLKVGTGGELVVSASGTTVSLLNGHLGIMDGGQAHFQDVTLDWQGSVIDNVMGPPDPNPTLVLRSSSLILGEDAISPVQFEMRAATQVTGELKDGQVMTMLGDSFAVSGNANLQVPTFFGVRAGGELVFDSTGNISSDLTASTGDPIRNSGTIRMVAGGGGFRRFSGELINGAAGLVEVNTDASNGRVQFGRSGADLLNQGVWRFDAQGVDFFGASMVNDVSGSFVGSVSLNLPNTPTYVMQNDGMVGPGLSPGTLSLDRDLALSGTGLFAVEIAGAGAGEFDRVEVVGDLELGGTLRVTVLNGYEPPADAEFEIATATGAVTGTFDELDGLEFSSRARFEVVYGATNVVLVTQTNDVAVDLFADFDGDGLPNGYEEENGLDPFDASDALLDPDGNGLSHLLEYVLDPLGEGMPTASQLLPLIEALEPGARYTYELPRLADGWDSAFDESVELPLFDLVPLERNVRTALPSGGTRHVLTQDGGLGFVRLGFEAVGISADMLEALYEALGE